MDKNRKTAYSVLMAIEIKKQYSNIALNNHIRREKPDSPAFVRELVYGVLENKKLLDYIISKLITGKIKNVRTPDLVILRMGIYQIAKMSSVPEYAAVDESVQMAKKYCRGREKFINGVLRAYIRDRHSIILPDKDNDIAKYLSVRYSYEEWIVKLWLEVYDAKFVEELLKAGNETPPITIRVNKVKVIKSDVKEKLLQSGFEVFDAELAQSALHVKGEGLLDTDMYKNGEFSVQDEASQLVTQYLKPEPTDFIIDVCAAPGGKTLAAAEKMHNKGRILAQDVYSRKVAGIENEAKRLGLSNVDTFTWDASKVREKYIGKADKVIVDAPCSGLGVIRRKPEIKYKKNNDEMAMLPVKQMVILEASSQYVREGGILVYSTCTINPYENERVVSDFVRKNPQFIIENAVQLLPNVNKTDGFYISVLKRKA